MSGARQLGIRREVGAVAVIPRHHRFGVQLDILDVKYTLTVTTS